MQPESSKSGYQKMGSMVNEDPSSSSNFPAAGEMLEPALGQALAQLDQFAKKQGFFGGEWPDHPRLLRELLIQSQHQAKQGISPQIPKGDLAAPARIKLDTHYWKRFETWFNRRIQTSLREQARISGIPAVRAIRQTSPKGGHPSRSEARIFLSFDTGNFSNADSGFIKETQVTDEGAFQSSDPLARTEELQVSENDPAEAPRCYAPFQGKVRWLMAKLVKENIEINVPTATKKRWQFGLSMVLLGGFLLVFSNFLPQESRSMFISFSIILFIAGLWDMDRANQGFSR